MMDLSLYFKPVVKWRRLVILAGLLSALATFLISFLQPEIYQASATLIIGQSINNPNPSSNQFYLEQDLAGIYADMANRDPIRSATMSALGINSLPMYTVRALPNTQLLEIDVQDTQPQRAQAVAAELANQLIQRSPTGVRSAAQSQQAFVDSQLSSLQNDILSTQDEIASLKLKLGGLRDARDIADVEGQISASDEKLRTLQSSYATLLSSSGQGAVNTLSVVEPPELPKRPVGPSRLFIVFLAAILGMAVGTAGAYVIEYLDKSVKENSDITSILRWPVLSTLHQVEGVADIPMIVLEQPRSVIANSFRLLKTNLELAGVGSLVRSVLITGPSVGEGKSSVAMGVALAFAKSGEQVVLVDADFERSRYSVPGQKGLSDLLVEDGNPGDTPYTPFPNKVPNLSVVGPGTASLGSAWFLDTPVFDKFLSELSQKAIVIIDGPPTFTSDSLVLAAKAEGVLTVVRLEHSKKDTVRAMRSQLQSNLIHVLGVVINGTRVGAARYESYMPLDDLATLGPEGADRSADRWRAEGARQSTIFGLLGRVVGRFERWLSGRPGPPDNFEQGGSVKGTPSGG